MKNKNIYKRGFNLFYTCWNIYPKILKKIRFKKDEKVLDAGCGDGKLGVYLKLNNLYGVDFSPEAIKKIDKEAYKKCTTSSLEKIPFKDKSFDSTISIQVLQYVEDPKKIFEEILRVTKKRIIITSANFNWFRLKSFIYPPYRKTYSKLISNERYISKELFEKWAKEHGLKLKIFYISNKYGRIRNIIGNWLSSEVVGVFYRK